MILDPTLELLARLNDATKWVVRAGVPIFKAHVRRNPEGAELYTVTDPILEEIAANTAKLESRHGVVGRITGGHLKYAEGENAQPELYGFWRNARMGTFGPSGEKAILVDQYVFPEKAAMAGSKPYRSAEYIEADRTIRGLALLLRDPYLDLGTVHYNGSEAVFYSNDPETSVEPTPEELALFAKHSAYLAKKFATPAPVVPVVPVEPEAQRMQREQQAVQYAALQAETVALKATVADLTKAGLLATCEREIIQIEAEGYALVRAEEVAELASKPDAAARTAYLARIRSNYKQDPNKANRPPVGTVQLYSGHVEAGAAQIAEVAHTAKADAIMRATPGMTFEDAWAKTA